ncbi:MAG: hypothetical protein LBM20_06695 [Rikenellaceae bacterium]|jgi:predicted DNA-binding protein YlxM (UPF0122 family)|nr:hypothetical protein [Rikenellaceae bacterium]
MKRATISADIIASSSLSSEELDRLTQWIHTLFTEIRAYQEHLITARLNFLEFSTLSDFKKFSIAQKYIDKTKEGGETFGIRMRLVAGDLIECLLLYPNDALQMTLSLKAGIKSFPLDNTVKQGSTTKKYRKLFETYGIRAAIGIGEMDMKLSDKGIWNGEAIYLSGRRITEQKTSNKERVTIKNSLFFDSFSLDQKLIFQPMLSLLDTLFTKMTRKQSEIIYHRLIGRSEQEIADNLKISQSSVNQHLKKAGWGAIKESLDLFSYFDFQDSPKINLH